ncbi:MAG: PQQ-dependent dehydrogenase, methanol/ethanol family [Novosphingobium sp.]|nr:PQQ-dependent dehydrogenase, methanol/ethanol family [Novosphingobium sp.]
MELTLPRILDVKSFFCLALSACLAACGAAGRSPAALDDGVALGDWPGYGRGASELHFSPLEEISSKNVDRLGLVSWLDLGPGNSVTAPVAVGGRVYFVTGLSIVHAIDPVTGKELWQFDPGVPEIAGDKLRLGWGTRGLAYWKGTIFFGTQDGRLISLDARDGGVRWSVQTLNRDDTSFISGAPRVFDGKVLIGFGGADLGNVRGYVTAYDAQTGKQLWRWYTVPGNPADGFENEAMRRASATWAGKWWEYGGGGTVWNAISYDPEGDTVFIGTGNGTPWNHKVRSLGQGDNLFLCSIVALDAKTGSYKWHYQINPGESWDYNAAMDMALADVEIEGRRRKVLMTAPKNGFFYVLDRLTGELISAEPFAKVTWASRIDLDTGRPVEHPDARYPRGKTFVMWPSSIGAHSWHPMAYSPSTRMAYIPVIEKAQSWTELDPAHGDWRKTTPPMTSRAAALTNPFPDVDDPRDGTSRLVAWDVVHQRAVWSQPTTGLAGGGVMATGGNLVFQGGLDGRFKAYAADSGKVLWSFDAQAPVMAPPISYAIDGRQYVTVLSGMGTSLAVFASPAEKFNSDYRTQRRRVLTFALDRHGKLPAPVAHKLELPDDACLITDEAQAARGATVFRRCASCHGMGAVAGGNAPDLRASPITYSAVAFRNVVKNGPLRQAGMPGFSELGDDQVEDLRAYLRVAAARLREKRQGAAPAEQKECVNP